MADFRESVVPDDGLLRRLGWCDGYAAFSPQDEALVFQGVLSTSAVASDRRARCRSVFVDEVGKKQA